MRFVLLLLMTAAQFSAAKELVFYYNEGPKWQMDSKTIEPFYEFLELEKTRLIERVPELVFDDNGQDVNHVLNQLDSSKATFPNRPMTCAFLDKVRANLNSPKLENELDQITLNGKICISADLPDQAAQIEWSTKLINFFWSRPWILLDGQRDSLKTWLDKKIGLPSPVQLNVVSLPNQTVEGYAYGYSPFDQYFISRHPLLAEIFEISTNIDPYDPRTYPNFGPEVATLLKEGGARSLVLLPTISIGYGVAAPDLIELIAHEYGHIIHAYNRLNLSMRDGVLSDVTADNVWSEGVAEAVAWVGLLQLDDIYPEIRTFHILKLSSFGKIRAEDPHYRGATGFAGFFHTRQYENALVNLHKFIMAKDMDAFMRQTNYHPFTKLAEPVYKPLRFVWDEVEVNNLAIRSSQTHSSEDD